MSITTINATDEERHSAAHILATAVLRVMPNTRVGIGPVTKEGFYYDFQFDRTPTKEDIIEIEYTANSIIKDNLDFKQLFLSRDEASDMLLRLGQIFKSELIKSIPDDQISFYKVGEEFIDLCRGPHLNSTGELGFIKIAKLEKVNWKNDPTRPEMIRIHGLVFKTENEFNEYVKLKSEKESKSLKNIFNNHNLGIISSDKTMLFSTGMISLRKIEDMFTSKFNKYEIKEQECIKISDSKDDNFITEYKSQTRSYKTLPIAYLSREKGISVLDDIEILNETINLSIFSNKLNTINLLIEVVEIFIDTINEIAENIVVKIYSSNLDDTKLNTLSNYLQKNVISHEKILTKELSDGNVRIDFYIKNSLNETNKFGGFENETLENLYYIDELNTRQTVSRIKINFTPISIYGSLLQDNGLKLPAKIHPKPVVIIPINKNNTEYALEVQTELRNNLIKPSIDLRSKSINYKIKNAIEAGTPFILIIGNKETANKAVSIRKNGVEMGLISINECIEMINNSLI